ncbi:MAG: RNA polymerase sigma factor [Myxococcota bacterium]|nr:RNA polymerase sigma factor [Myxococcota bacterium]
MLEELSDEQLMLSYQRGDTRAFQVLLSRHYQPLFNFLLRYTGNRATAEELLQDVFTRVIRSAKGYQTKAKFTTWIYTIARHITIDHSRRQKFRRHRSLDAPLSGEKDSQTLLDTVADHRPGGLGDQALADGQFKIRLQDALSSMNTDQREVFVLREFQNLSFKEISNVVNASENTVKSRMRYALEFLRSALADFT